VSADPGLRVGTGIDVHPFAPGRPLLIGGVPIPSERGLAGHSDADVLLHAICDALLGAAALGDIGSHFPDSDPELRGISSLELLRRTVALLAGAGFRPLQIDACVIAEEPRLAPHYPAMRRAIAGALGVAEGSVGVKATTAEGLGFTGRREGIAAQAVCLIARYPPTDRP
jgi:2-C-methyl-D-erythritol 2,4-cyclodiphosphate synthase